MPFFSIIIATYNSEFLIERALTSILKQDFEDYEIIVIDGKSSDKTLKIINKYSTQIKKVISEIDCGIYDAWNKGLSLAEGNWIMFLGSDDLLCTSALMNYYNFVINSELNLEYVSSLVQTIDTNGNLSRIIGKPWTWRVFKKYMCVAHVGSLHKNELFLKYGKFNTNYKITGDYEFLLRANDKLEAGFLNQITAKMQIGGISVNNNSFFETYNAKTITGGRNKIIAFIEMIKAFLILKIRNILK